MNINRIKTDITLAECGINPAINITNDEYLYDASAYHIQQAIEKSLKYILHNIYGEDDTTKKFKTHNISSLIIMLNSYDSDFINNHPDIVNIADEITKWEASSRYGESIVSTRNDIMEAIKYAKNLYDEILDYNKDKVKDETVAVLKNTDSDIEIEQESFDYE